MYKYQASTLSNTRIDVADVLRGIAIGGIVLIHFIEHLNFYSFPEPSSPFWAGMNKVVWDTTFYLLAGKMYAIFATLFGLSFFIQHDNQAQKGKAPDRVYDIQTAQQSVNHLGNTGSHLQPDRASG